MTHGGTRPGAGRKKRPVPLETISMHVEPGLKKAWKARCKKEGLSQPKTLGKLIGWDETKAARENAKKPRKRKKL